MKGLKAGKHTLRLDLKNNDHTDHSPKVSKELSFTVSESGSVPEITITSPKAGESVTGPDVTASFSVSNFEIQAPSDKSKVGKSHLHG